MLSRSSIGKLRAPKGSCALGWNNLEEHAAGLIALVTGCLRKRHVERIPSANELVRRNGKFGLLSVCAQGGMGFAMVLER